MSGRFERLDFNVARVELNSAIVASYQGDRAVLLDYENGQYFGLNAVGASIWKALTEGKSLDDVVAAISSEYDAEIGVIQQDLCSLLGELSERKMLAVRG